MSSAWSPHKLASKGTKEGGYDTVSNETVSEMVERLAVRNIEATLDRLDNIARLVDEFDATLEAGPKY